jgi:hypothetical protein
LHAAPARDADAARFEPSGPPRRRTGRRRNPVWAGILQQIVIGQFAAPDAPGAPVIEL